MHRTDVQSAFEGATTVDAALAVDGVDEVLHLTLAGNWSQEPQPDSTGTIILAAAERIRRVERRAAGLHDRLEPNVAGLGDQDGAEVLGAGGALGHVGELGEEPGSADDLEQHVGQVDSGQQLVHGRPQPEQARRFVQPIERGQDEPAVSVGGLDPDGGVVREPSGDRLVGAVKIAGEFGELAVGVEVVPEARRDALAGGLPGLALQEPGATSTGSRAPPRPPLDRPGSKSDTTPSPARHRLSSR